MSSLNKIWKNLGRPGKSFADFAHRYNEGEFRHVNAATPARGENGVMEQPFNANFLVAAPIPPKPGDPNYPIRVPSNTGIVKNGIDLGTDDLGGSVINTTPVQTLNGNSATDLPEMSTGMPGPGSSAGDAGGDSGAGGDNKACLKTCLFYGALGAGAGAVIVLLIKKLKS